MADYQHYKLVLGNDSEELAQLVTHSMKLGWKPIGGVAVTAVPASKKDLIFDYRFAQAMVRE